MSSQDSSWTKPSSMSAIDGPDETALMQSILNLSETLHLQTVAEGIENVGQLSELKSLGANLGQGFLFAKPLAPGDIAALLTSDGASETHLLEHRGVA